MTIRPIKSEACLQCRSWKMYCGMTNEVDCLLECEGKGQQVLVGERTK